MYCRTKLFRCIVDSIASYSKIDLNRQLLRARFNTSTAYNDLQGILIQSQSEEMPSISTAQSILENAAQDASSYTLEKPDICIVPTTVNQIQQCVKYCYDNDIPIIPVGARTGLEGGIHAMRGGVSFDLSQMKRVLEVNPGDLDCHVESGLSWRELNDHVKSHGLWFPVDPGASASLGGMSATSASGTNAVKYGTMRENVLGVEVVVSNGEVITTPGRECHTRKSSAGINLTNLFVGSEGTLGIITSVRLKLHALPTCLAVATVAFPDNKSASDSVVQVMQCGIPIARIEFLDQQGVNACYQDSKLANLDPTKPMLFVELHALSESGLEDQVDLLRDIFEAHGASKFNWSSKQEERTQLWKARHNLHWSNLKTKPGSSCVTTDVCVPISRFPEMIENIHELIKRFGVSAPCMGHAGDGNLHSDILYDPSKPEEFKNAKLLAEEMGRAAIRLGGTVTGEHGVGKGKVELIEEQFDRETLDVMYTIKKALDPKNLFNPDKMFKSAHLDCLNLQK